MRLESIYSADDRFEGVIASLASPTGVFRDVAEPEITFTYIPTVQYLYAAFTEFTATPPKTNILRETLIKQIDSLSDDPDAYEDGERAPDNATRDSAKQIIREVYPAHLLSGADVYAFYGEISVSWESQQRKVKLIVPPLNAGRPTAIYHGRMNQGKVVESALEPAATPKRLAAWLIWLQG